MVVWDEKVSFVFACLLAGWMGAKGRLGRNCRTSVVGLGGRTRGLDAF